MNVKYNDTFLLHSAISLGNFEIIKLLLGSGADVNAKDGRGNTPLHVLCGLVRNCDEYPQRWIVPKIMKLLLESGANVNDRNSKGLTGFYNFFDFRVFFIRDTDMRDSLKICLKLLTECVDVNSANNDKSGKEISDFLVAERWSGIVRENFYNIILEHLAKLKVLNFQIDSSILNAIATNLKYREYFEICTEELKLAKS